MTAVDRKRTLVVAALIRREGTILLSQRRPDQPMPNLWEFPGGKVEPGESPVTALVREIQEELGCQIEVERIEEAVFHAYPAFDLYMLVYNCRIVGGEAHAVEVARFAWIPVGRVPTMDLLPADYPLARRLASESQGS